MSTKMHVCRSRPGFKSKDDPWVDGPLTGCPYHGPSGKSQRRVKMSKTDRAKADKAAGVIGKDDGHGALRGDPRIKDW